VFINGGRQSVVRVVHPPPGNAGIEAFADGAGTVEAWLLRSIW